MKRIVKNHIQLHPKIPILFYWWTPDEFTADTEVFTRVRLPKYDPEIAVASGACDFGTSKLSKFVSASMPLEVTEFVKNFRIDQDSINYLLKI